VPKEVKPYVTQLADSARQRLLEQGIIKDPDHDPIVGKFTSYEKGIQNLGLTPDTDITPEQKTIQTLQSMGIDTTPLQKIMPSLFTSASNTQQTSTTPQTSTTQQGTVVPTYGKTATGNVVQTSNKSNVPPPAGTVPIRNFLKDVYGLSDDAFVWDNTKGLTIKTGDKEFNLGKPRSSEEGQIINGTWYTTPNYVETAMSMNGIKRQKDPIREALPKYLESKGITGATVTWDKDTNQVILKVGDKQFKLGTPQQIGSLYNGTTYVSQADIEKALAPFAKELGLDLGTAVSSETTSGESEKDLTQMTIPEIQLQEEINKTDIMKKTYSQLLDDIQKGEDELLNKIHETYKDLIDQSIQTMENALKDAKAALEGAKGNYDEYQKVAFEEIDKSVEAAKAKSKEEMAARGVYFSGLTTRALNQLEAQGISEKNKVRMQVLQWKAQIDAQIAILTANTKMSEAQLQNELLAREALEKLQLIEKNQDKKDAIKQEMALLDAQIEIDKLNLPLENELYRRQQEIQSQKDAMDFMEKICIPMLKLQYEDQWKQEDLDLAYMKYQQSLISFFEDTKEFWAKLGLDKDKFLATFQWDKEKFAQEMGFKEKELALKQSSSSSSETDVETWVEKYLPYITMQPDKLDAILSSSNASFISKEDYDAISAISKVLHSLEPKNRGNFLSAFKDLSNIFTPDGAIELLNAINTNIPEALLLKQLATDYGSLKEFAYRFKYATDDQKKSYISDIINKFKNTYKITLDNNTITSVFTFVTSLFE
jgi:hypothetical protein